MTGRGFPAADMKPLNRPDRRVSLEDMFPVRNILREDQGPSHEDLP